MRSSRQRTSRKRERDNATADVTARIRQQFYGAMHGMSVGEIGRFYSGENRSLARQQAAKLAGLPVMDETGAQVVSAVHAAPTDFAALVNKLRETSSDPSTKLLERVSMSDPQRHGKIPPALVPMFCHNGVRMGPVRPACFPEAGPITEPDRDEMATILASYSDRIEGLMSEMVMLVVPQPKDITVDTKMKNIKPFMPSYRVTTAWRAPYTGALGDPNSRSYIVAGPRSLGDRIEAARAYNSTVAQYILTSGTAEGQLMRLANIRAVGEASRLELSPSERVDVNWKTDLDAALGSPDSRGITLTQVSDVMANPNLQVVAMSDSGPYWVTMRERFNDAGWGSVGAKRIKTLAADLLFAKRLRDDLIRTPEYSTRVTTVFVAMYRNCFLKPKFETIHRSKVFTKVRNINVFNSFTQVLLGLFIRDAQKSIVPQEPGVGQAGPTNSLYGFTGSRNGFEKLLHTLTSTELRFRVLGYSDNLYIWDNDSSVLYSCDVEKMESTSTREEAKAMMQYLLDKYENDSDGLHSHLVFMGSSFCHDTPAILGDGVFVNTGLSSGSQTTFITNHCRMMVYARRLEGNLNASPGEAARMLTSLDANLTANHSSKAFPTGSPLSVSLSSQVASVFGQSAPFNLELTISSASTHMTEMVPPNAPMFRIGDFLAGATEAEEFGPYSQADLLGTVITLVRFRGRTRAIAVLDYDRTMKAITFRKRPVVRPDADLSINKVTADAIGNVIDLTTVTELYASGGFAFLTTSVLVRNAITSILFALRVTYEVGSDSLDGRPESPVDFVRRIQNATTLYTTKRPASGEEDSYPDPADLEPVFERLVEFMNDQIGPDEWLMEREELLAHYYFQDEQSQQTSLLESHNAAHDPRDFF